MIKKIIILLFFSSTLLFAQEASQEQLNDIYKEAVLFVAIFGIMGLVSYIYSSRHAKEYVPKGPSKEELAAEAFKVKRKKELLSLLDGKKLTENEFEVLIQYYK